LIRDWDKLFSHLFAALVTHSGIEVIQTLHRTPKANAFCERFFGSLKRECLDHSLILHQIHLNRLVKDYRSYFKEERPHQGINQRIPHRLDRLPIIESGENQSVAFLEGLQHIFSLVSGWLTGQFTWWTKKVSGITFSIYSIRNN
jgi:putative transposase